MCRAPKDRIISKLKNLDKGGILQIIVSDTDNGCKITKKRLRETGIPPRKAYAAIAKLAQVGDKTLKNNAMHYDGRTARLEESARRAIYSLCRILEYPIKI